MIIGRTDMIQVFHAYAYGTAFWYGLRGLCRVYDPVMVIGCTLPKAAQSSPQLLILTHHISTSEP